MTEQIAVAAKWWADQLRCETKQDNGDALCSAVSFLVSKLSELPDPQLVDNFEKVLRERLEVLILKSGWDKNNPKWGSYFRTIGCDYGPDHFLHGIAVECGIKASCPPFPMKTIMWIYSDSVRVAHGYGAEPRKIWEESEKEND